MCSHNGFDTARRFASQSHDNHHQLQLQDASKEEK